jgi:P-type E1-E2 ATPase
LFLQNRARTGRASEVRYLAGAVGISEIYSGQSPEQKVAIVREETNRAKTLFVGDGINDAPTMQAATVSLAFGLSSDVAAEAADAVFLESSLGKVDERIHIGRRMRSIALQSAVGGMALSALGMLAAAFGFLPAIDGAIELVPSSMLSAWPFPLQVTRYLNPRSGKCRARSDRRHALV